MYFRQIPHAASNNLCYLLSDPATGEAVLIDAHPEQTELLCAMLAERDLQLRWLLRTHIHSATDTCEALCSACGAVCLSGFNGRLPHTRQISDGDVLVFGDLIIKVIATPGHTPEALSFLCQDRLFCGDALHPSGCPAPVDATNAGQWFDNVTRRLFMLPGETLVFPGHLVGGRTISTIAEERRQNRAFGTCSRETFITELGRNHGGIFQTAIDERKY
ncbi:MAG: hypothetical protein KDJ38_15385 [Gammaproteobacteria bacterium]|nr:hypothetical protein [Gammaproteobacteria bacterium]